MSAPYRIADFGPSDLLTSPNEEIRRVKVSVNEQLIGGNQALTVQSFTELNVKAGAQFETASYTPDAVTEDVLIRTGSLPVIVKAIELQIDGDGIQYQLLTNITATPGTLFQVSNLNAMSDKEAEVEVSLVQDADTANATPVSPLMTLIGSTSPGTATTPTATIPGLERILAPNTDYLFRRESLTQSQEQGSDFYMTWHEGELSTNVPLEV